MQKKKKNFLKLPVYPGGNKALKEFISKSLVYPEDAIKQQIEGKVYVHYEVNDNGKVLSANIIKGLGYGCDEEALRLVKLLQYEKVKNIGQRVKSSMKITIIFKLRPQTPPSHVVQYTYTTGKGKKEAPKTVYNYTLNINQSNHNE